MTLYRSDVWSKYSTSLNVACNSTLINPSLSQRTILLAPHQQTGLTFYDDVGGAMDEGPQEDPRFSTSQIPRGRFFESLTSTRRIDEEAPENLDACIEAKSKQQSREYICDEAIASG
ncbi:unnamed protein product [Didymodactylos carnosus]|uniref:Uncharacterized protein n=1 Tax=Didymodactylos carnosus TaxID=1234261 RepID=A0A814B658_9BILA|nr:unnamed protein product [Didymodactylos carnosus]CAF0921574.1 unnamed protein product [Didymodactylos carnosus]CAF3594222.1 unnamed protein product [Didymodactylos carnosus]CAF3700772.1 unnamed protein product [Didymodactylos carnosus]